MRYLIVLLLAGCATQEQIHARQQAYVAKLAAQCDAYGFQRGSAEFSQCVMRLDMANRQSNRRALESSVDALNKDQSRPANMIHCSPDGIGGTICR